ncbi:MAG: hypothetical protein Kow0059_14030 [Candidatus Sumerlaeia bacterium]
MALPRHDQDNDRLQQVLERFRCRNCGNCCRGGGTVSITAEEAERIRRSLGIGRREFLRRFARPHRRAFVLRDRPGPLRECIFLEDNRCLIHSVKPVQCRDFPHRWRDRRMLNECAGMREAWTALLREEEAGVAPG